MNFNAVVVYEIRVLAANILDLVADIELPRTSRTPTDHIWALQSLNQDFYKLSGWPTLSLNFASVLLVVSQRNTFRIFCQT